MEIHSHQQMAPMMGPMGGNIQMNQAPNSMPGNNGNNNNNNNGPPGVPGGGQARPMDDYQSHLNTYIYDYLLRSELWDLARLWVKTMAIVAVASTGDNKGKRPADLPEPSIPPHASDTSFLYDWWCQFWDVFSATRGGNSIAAHYLKHAITLSKTRQENQNRMLRSGIPVPGPMFNPNMQPGMIRPGMDMPANLAQQQQQQQQNAAAMAAMQQRRVNTMPGRAPPGRMPPQNMVQQQPNGVRRDASTMEMNPHTPNGNGDNPGSPKRPRQDIGPQNGSGLNLVPAHPRPSVAPASHAGALPGPTMHSMVPMGMNGGAVQPGGPPGMRGMNQPPNHENSTNALQDYQAQLMLLEYQNKKRLLKAKQDQDNITAPNPSGPLIHGGFVAPSMESSGSRAGPSPNPEQLKRVASGLNQHGSPMNEGNRRPAGSPAANYDPQGPQFMDKNMSQSGPMNARPPSAMSNPPLMPPGMNHDPLSGNNGGQINGSWNPPPGMNPAPQMGTPQQRASVTTSMGPPPVPLSNDQQRLQSSSPSQTGPPPTPSQTGKGGPKAKKEPRKKAPPKRSASTTTAATSAPTNQGDMEPPTPTTSQPNVAPPGAFMSNLTSSMPNEQLPMPTTSHPSMSQMPELTDPNDASFLLEPPFAGLDGMNDGAMSGYDDIFNVDFTSGSFGLDSPHFT